MEQSILPIVAVAIAVLTFAATHYRTKALSDLDNRLGRLETKVEIYFDLTEKYNLQVLHREDDLHQVDKLAETQDRRPLSENEAETLEQKLEKILNNKSLTPGERAAAGNALAARKARNAE